MITSRFYLLERTKTPYGWVFVFSVLSGLEKSLAFEKRIEGEEKLKNVNASTAYEKKHVPLK